MNSYDLEYSIHIYRLLVSIVNNREYVMAEKAFRVYLYWYLGKIFFLLLHTLVSVL